MFHIHINAPNITDWIQILLTIITIIIAVVGTYYVRKNFHEQKVINQEQLVLASQQKELNRLTMEKDRRSIQPRFRVSLSGSWHTDVFLHVTLTNAPAYNMSAESEDDFLFNLDRHYIMYDEWEVGIELKFKIDRVIVSFTPEEGYTYAPFDDRHIRTFKFNDIDGRSYTQDLWFDGGRAKITLPTLKD